MLLQGDDLIVQVFFWTSGVLAGYEAMKASGWRIVAFGTLAGALIIIGLSWGLLKDVYPPLTRWVAEIATNPQSWFILIVIGLVLVAVMGRKPSKGPPAADTTRDEAAPVYDDNYLRSLVNEVQQKQAALETTLKEITPAHERLGQLDRTAFLLSVATTDAMYRERLEAALAHLPDSPNDMPIDTDEKMKREIGRLNKYFSDVGANLSGSRWWEEFHSVIQRAQAEADSDLLRNDAPAGLHSQYYRLFHIARMCRDRTQGFLERSIAEADQQEKNMLQMLRERPDIHKFPRKS